MEIENVRILLLMLLVLLRIPTLLLISSSTSSLTSSTNPKTRYAEVLGHHERAESSQGTEIFNEIDLFEPADHMLQFDMMDTL